MNNEKIKIIFEKREEDIDATMQLGGSPKMLLAALVIIVQEIARLLKVSPYHLLGTIHKILSASDTQGH